MSTITPEQRAEINRQNARNSTGPKSPEGKAASSRNALRHGLRVETLALPIEDSEELRALADRWHDFYAPATPGEEELVDLAVYSIVQRRRGARHLAVVASRRVRTAEVAFDQARREEVDRLGPELFGPRPFAAVVQAKRTAAGCRFLLDFWDEVAAMFAAQGFLNPEQRDLAIRLSGDCPEQHTTAPMAYLIRLYNLLCQPHDCPQTLVMMLQPMHIPARLRETMALWTPTPEHARDWLGRKLADEIADLAALEERLRLEVEEPDRADAAARAALLDGHEAELMIRYERMHGMAFHRAYSALLKGRQDDGFEAPRAPTPAAPHEASALPGLPSPLTKGGPRGVEAQPAADPLQFPLGKGESGAIAPNEAPAPNEATGSKSGSRTAPSASRIGQGARLVPPSQGTPEQAGIDMPAPMRHPGFPIDDRTENFAKSARFAGILLESAAPAG